MTCGGQCSSPASSGNGGAARGSSPGGAGLSIARSPLFFGFAPLVAEVVVDDRVVRLPLAHHLLDLHTWKPQRYGLKQRDAAIAALTLGGSVSVKTSQPYLPLVFPSLSRFSLRYFGFCANRNAATDVEMWYLCFHNGPQTECAPKSLHTQNTSL